MLQFKLGEQPFSLPVSWREVSLSQFKKIIAAKPGDLVEILSILSGLDYDLLFKTVRPKEENDRLIKAIQFAGQLPDWFSEPLPKEFKIGDKVIDLNIQIGTEQFGQYALFLSLAATNPMVYKDKLYCNINNIDKAIAIYCYPQVSGKEFGSKDEWMELIPIIDQLPFLECHAVATFFLNRFNSSQKPGQKKLRVKSQKQKKKRG